MNGPFALRHPLDGAVAANASRRADHLEILAEPMVVSVVALPSRVEAVETVLRDTWPEQIRTIGPGDWLLVGAHLDQTLPKALKARLASDALVTDQSSGRAVMLLSGPHCRDILAKLTPLDLDPQMFETGRSATAFFAHVSATITRTGEDLFEIALMRSFALFAYEELMEMGLEFGLTAGFAT